MRSADEKVSAIAAATARERRLIAARRGEAMDQPGDQLAALLDLSRALAGAGIPYALIGGIAVGIHAAAPRTTVDIDIAVPTRMERAAVISAPAAAGFREPREFPHSVILRHPGGEPVQVAFEASFDAMMDRAESFEIGGVAIRVVKKDDLIAMKERAAQDPARRRSKALRDQADIELLRGDVPEPDEGW